MLSSGKREWMTRVTVALLLAVCSLIGWKLWGGSDKLPVVGHAPNFTLTDMYGRTVPLRESDGNVRIVSVHYTRCPDIRAVYRMGNELDTDEMLADIHTPLKDE